MGLPRIVVRDRYLFLESGERFFVKGVAFPNAPVDNPYNATGWIAILKQLRDASVEVNALRFYQLDPQVDYSAFFEAADSMGFYILVPLTSAQGGGVLDRNKAAPKCYSRKLYQYGTSMVDMTRVYSNVIGGVLANEVMNSVETWQAAPCILSYANDLKLYQPAFPLIYSMQHDGLGAAISPAEAVQLTLDYLTCSTNSSIDILGVNIESWCSSTQQFDRNEDGSIGTYLDLYKHVENATIPLMFSEMGCSTSLFNRDNGLSPRGARDWKQVHEVLGEDMADELSGFIAYAYDGPPTFRMTTGGCWDGTNPLDFGQDMDNFVQAMKGLTPVDKQKENPSGIRPSCHNVAVTLKKYCQLELVPIESMPSYYHKGINVSKLVEDGADTLDESPGLVVLAIVLLAYIILSLCACIYDMRRRFVAPPTGEVTLSGGVSFAKDYNTFSS
jgi:hypothetical protein